MISYTPHDSLGSQNPGPLSPSSNPATMGSSSPPSSAQRSSAKNTPPSPGYTQKSPPSGGHKSPPPSAKRSSVNKPRWIKKGSKKEGKITESLAKKTLKAAGSPKASQAPLVIKAKAKAGSKPAPPAPQAKKLAMKAMKKAMKAMKKGDHLFFDSGDENADDEKFWSADENDEVVA